MDLCSSLKEPNTDKIAGWNLIMIINELIQRMREGGGGGGGGGGGVLTPWKRRHLFYVIHVLFFKPAS